MSVKIPPPVLAVAAMEPVCAAGLGADILTLRAHRCHPLIAVAAATAQDCDGLRGLWPTPASGLRAQLLAISAAPLAAIKIGAIVTAANARTLGKFLDNRAAALPPVVWDPVLATGRGDPLADDDAIAAMKKCLLPRAFIITPNRAEALRLTGLTDAAAATESNETPQSDASRRRQNGNNQVKSGGGGGASGKDGDDGVSGEDVVCEAARRLLVGGARYVLITDVGGAGATVRHQLFGEREGKWSCRRLAGQYHGSGCAFAAALTANLARRIPLKKAIWRANRYACQTLRFAYSYPALGAQKIPRR